MKIVLFTIIFIFIAMLFYLYFLKKKPKKITKSLVWWGPAGKIPPNPPVRWGYKKLCKKRTNC